jgi:hypothetical protein
MKRIINALLNMLFGKLSFISLRGAIKSQKLGDLKDRLEQAVPDISAQYSMAKIDNSYLRFKVRGLHAFQMSLFEKAAAGLPKDIQVADIGDSAGTHTLYVKSLFSGQKNIKCLSVNVDPLAIKRIKEKGLEAIQADVEEMDKYKISADIFMCFEILEHLNDPIGFLQKLAKTSDSKFAIITVPFVRKSRVMLRYIRENRRENVNAENTHVFELCPEDWKLIFKHAGWGVAYEDTYLQYPTGNILRLTKPLWRKFDYEGFYGVILKKDITWPSIYNKGEFK